jgi:multiple sugar transport system substrate-binding protein
MKTKILFGIVALASLMAQPSRADDVVFLSTQLRPVEEAQKVRDLLLKGGPKATFVPEEPQNVTVRVKAEQDAGKHTISLIGALHGELSPLVPMNALDPVDDVAAKVANLGIPANLMTLGKLGGDKQLYIPWIQATYVMAASKEALKYLPQGADINALTYEQLGQWAKAVADKTGQRRLGFPAGPKGLFARFLQGYLVPAYTGSVVSEFRSADAEKMWGDFKTLWASVNPNSTNYDFMQDPMQGGEVWIVWDHVSRLKEALNSAPDQYVVFPPPAGPKGRAYMPVVAGLAIAKDAPARADAAAVIAQLLKPETQIRTTAETGFFPVIDAKLPADLVPGIKLEADAVAKMQSAKDALVVLLPVGLGDKGGEFNKVYFDTFQRIVLRGEPIRATLDAQAEALRAVMNAAKAPCWAPDPPSQGVCPVK